MEEPPLNQELWCKSDDDNYTVNDEHVMLLHIHKVAQQSVS